MIRLMPLAWMLTLLITGKAMSQAMLLTEPAQSPSASTFPSPAVPAEIIMGSPPQSEVPLEFGGMEEFVMPTTPSAKQLIVPFSPGASMVAGGNVSAIARQDGLENQEGPIFDTIDASSGHVAVGFVFIVPSWSDEQFQTLVPAEFAADFPVLGAANAQGSNLDYTPSFKLDYKHTEEGPGLNFSGTFLNLLGKVTENVTDSTLGSGSIQATSDITAILVSAPEIGFNRNWSDFQLRYSIASEYVQLDQNYNAAITNGSNSSILHAEQHFKGIGIRTAVENRLPLQAFGQVGEEKYAAKDLPAPNVPYRLSLYSQVAGNFVAGSHYKASSLGVVTTSAEVIDNVVQDRSRFMTVAELEAGVEWRFRFETFSNRLNPSDYFTVRTALYGQLWSGAGLLDPRSDATLDSDLNLLGLTVKAGVNW